MSIIDKLIALANSLDTQFTLNQKPLPAREVFNDTGLLPAIARRADQLCSLCLGYGIGITFQEESQSLLGVKVIFDEITPSVLRLLCILDVLTELVQSSPMPGTTPLDELMYD